MKKEENYSAVRRKKYIEKLRLVLNDLPPFSEYYFRATESLNSPLTRYGYAIDIRTFFLFCVKELSAFSCYSVREITIEVLNKLTSRDIEQYLEYLSYYSDADDTDRENSNRAKARKLSALRAFLKYYYKQGMIDSNPSTLVDTPKIHEKPIVRLEANEVANLLDITEEGSGLSKRQKIYHDKTAIRDTAIISLFLGTGIRISELVGINKRDIDFSGNSFVVTRKGGNLERLSFSQEVADALKEYKEYRETIIPVDGHEDAFFLSLQKKRITARAVEKLVEKYASLATPLKPITPHKLRSTYGTMLYEESGDIYLVADALGHKDVNTTRKHYAALSEERRRTASKYIHLRDDQVEKGSAPNQETDS